MREMTPEEKALAAELFREDDRPPGAKGEGIERLTIRFDNTTPGAVYYGPHARTRKVRMPFTTVLRYTLVEGGVQTLLVRTKEGHKWTGTVKPGTDVVVLQRVGPEKDWDRGRID
jgi:hypothetical protein